VSGIRELRAVAVDETHLYWAASEGIWRMPRPF
jgi:hypothetical protein